MAPKSPSLYRRRCLGYCRPSVFLTVLVAAAAVLVLCWFQPANAVTVNWQPTAGTTASTFVTFAASYTSLSDANGICAALPTLNGVSAELAVFRSDAEWQTFYSGMPAASSNWWIGVNPSTSDAVTLVTGEQIGEVTALLGLLLQSVDHYIFSWYPGSYGSLLAGSFQFYAQYSGGSWSWGYGTSGLSFNAGTICSYHPAVTQTATDYHVVQAWQDHRTWATASAKCRATMQQYTIASSSTAQTQGVVGSLAVLNDAPSGAAAAWLGTAAGLSGHTSTLSFGVWIGARTFTSGSTVQSWEWAPGLTTWEMNSSTNPTVTSQITMAAAPYCDSPPPGEAVPQVCSYSSLSFATDRGTAVGAWTSGGAVDFASWRVLALTLTLPYMCGFRLPYQVANSRLVADIYQQRSSYALAAARCGALSRYSARTGVSAPGHVFHVTGVQNYGVYTRFVRQGALALWPNAANRPTYVWGGAQRATATGYCVASNIMTGATFDRPCTEQYPFTCVFDMAPNANTLTPSETPSMTPVPTPSRTALPTPSPTQSISRTQSASRVPTPTRSALPTPSDSHSQTPVMTTSKTKAVTKTPSTSRTEVLTQTDAITPTRTLTRSFGTRSNTHDATETPGATKTATRPHTDSRSSTLSFPRSISRTLSHTRLPTETRTRALTDTATVSRTRPQTASPTKPDTVTHTASPTMPLVPIEDDPTNFAVVSASGLAPVVAVMAYLVSDRAAVSVIQSMSVVASSDCAPLSTRKLGGSHAYSPLGAAVQFTESRVAAFIGHAMLIGAVIIAHTLWLVAQAVTLRVIGTSRSAACWAIMKRAFCCCCNWGRKKSHHKVGRRHGAAGPGLIQNGESDPVSAPSASERASNSAAAQSFSTSVPGGATSALTKAPSQPSTARGGEGGTGRNRSRIYETGTATGARGPPSAYSSDDSSTVDDSDSYEYDDDDDAYSRGSASTTAPLPAHLPDVTTEASHGIAASQHLGRASLRSLMCKKEGREAPVNGAANGPHPLTVTVSASTTAGSGPRMISSASIMEGDAGMLGGTAGSLVPPLVLVSASSSNPVAATAAAENVAASPRPSSFWRDSMARMRRLAPFIRARFPHWTLRAVTFSFQGLVFESAVLLVRADRTTIEFVCGVCGLVFGACFVVFTTVYCRQVFMRRALACAPVYDAVNALDAIAALDAKMNAAAGWKAGDGGAAGGLDPSSLLADGKATKQLHGVADPAAPSGIDIRGAFSSALTAMRPPQSSLDAAGDSGDESEDGVDAFSCRDSDRVALNRTPQSRGTCRGSMMVRMSGCRSSVGTGLSSGSFAALSPNSTYDASTGGSISSGIGPRFRGRVPLSSVGVSPKPTCVVNNPRGVSRPPARPVFGDSGAVSGLSTSSFPGAAVATVLADAAGQSCLPGLVSSPEPSGPIAAARWPSASIGGAPVRATTTGPLGDSIDQPTAIRAFDAASAGPSFGTLGALGAAAASEATFAMSGVSSTSAGMLNGAGGAVETRHVLKDPSQGRASPFERRPLHAGFRDSESLAAIPAAADLPGVEGDPQVKSKVVRRNSRAVRGSAIPADTETAEAEAAPAMGINIVVSAPAEAAPSPGISDALDAILRDRDEGALTIPKSVTTDSVMGAGGTPRSPDAFQRPVAASESASRYGAAVMPAGNAGGGSGFIGGSGVLSVGSDLPSGSALPPQCDHSPDAGRQGGLPPPGSRFVQPPPPPPPSSTDDCSGFFARVRALTGSGSVVGGASSLGAAAVGNRQSGVFGGQPRPRSWRGVLQTPVPRSVPQAGSSTYGGLVADSSAAGWANSQLVASGGFGSIGVADSLAGGMSRFAGEVVSLFSRGIFGRSGGGIVGAASPIAHDTGASQGRGVGGASAGMHWRSQMSAGVAQRVVGADDVFSPMSNVPLHHQNAISPQRQNQHQRPSAGASSSAVVAGGNPAGMRTDVVGGPRERNNNQSSQSAFGAGSEVSPAAFTSLGNVPVDDDAASLFVPNLALHPGAAGYDGHDDAVGGVDDDATEFRFVRPDDEGEAADKRLVEHEGRMLHAAAIEASAVDGQIDGAGVARNGRNSDRRRRRNGIGGHILSSMSPQNLLRGRGIGSATYWVPYVPAHFTRWPALLNAVAPSGYWETDAVPVALFGALVDNLRPGPYLQWTAGAHYAVLFAIAFVSARDTANPCESDAMTVAGILAAYGVFCLIGRPFRWGIDNVLMPLLTLGCAIFTIVLRQNGTAGVAMYMLGIYAFVAVSFVIHAPISLLESMKWVGTARRWYSLDRCPRPPPDIANGEAPQGLHVPASPGVDYARFHRLLYAANAVARIIEHCDGPVTDLSDPLVVAKAPPSFAEKAPLGEVATGNAGSSQVRQSAVDDHHRDLPIGAHPDAPAHAQTASGPARAPSATAPPGRRFVIPPAPVASSDPLEFIATITMAASINTSASPNFATRQQFIPADSSFSGGVYQRQNGAPTIRGLSMILPPPLIQSGTYGEGGSIAVASTYTPPYRPSVQPSLWQRNGDDQQSVPTTGGMSNDRVGREEEPPVPPPPCHAVFRVTPSQTSLPPPALPIDRMSLTLGVPSVAEGAADNSDDTSFTPYGFSGDAQQQSEQRACQMMVMPPTPAGAAPASRGPPNDARQFDVFDDAPGDSTPMDAVRPAAAAAIPQPPQDWRTFDVPSPYAAPISDGAHRAARIEQAAPLPRLPLPPPAPRSFGAPQDRSRMREDVRCIMFTPPEETICAVVPADD